ncbi:type II toxin-antitoxin system VapC family toxin [Daejeonella sp.]|uniref:type II toxin-antitoxin system VapC family toxin n=1 Tax=Daejeonella sp. TaxID=2805397 RepID=UPI0027320BC5|nr:type II toxin-antitoxin system VapC family toxin [Daejeonella sp.]MDP2412815.1 type II toxin-antitoxin system VapC family toxin [Daejeonella sp.]
MDYLLDTHTFLWFINGSEELSDKAKSAIENIKNTKFISIASFWEIAIKSSLGKLKLDIPFQELKFLAINNGFEILPLTFEHTNRLVNLDFHHKDPFDRLIIAQAITDKLTIIGKDRNFAPYSVKIIW